MLSLQNKGTNENITLAEMKDGTAYTGNTFRIEKAGTYQLKLRCISSVDSIEQGLLISLLSFKGKLSIDGDEYPMPKRKYPKVLISQEDFQTDLEIQVTLAEGSVVIMNASYDTEIDRWDYYTYYHLMNIEKKGANSLRCCCRAHEDDKNFSDLVFDIEITKCDG